MRSFSRTIRTSTTNSPSSLRVFQRHLSAQCQSPITPIRDELSLAVQYLPPSLSQAFRHGGMVNPEFLDSNFFHRSLRKRPQYTCGYSKAHDLISIYFHCSDPTYNDAVTDLNIKHHALTLNDNTVNVHTGFLDYLINPRYNFLEGIISELQSFKTMYHFDTSSNSKTRVIVTGQSLGAALSQLFYLLMFTDSDCYDSDQQQALKELIPFNKDNIFVITFGSPSFMHCNDVDRYFKSSDGEFYDLNQRIFNFHAEKDPIPMLLTGNQPHLQTKHVSFREVVRNDEERRLDIASNYHLGNNLALIGGECINMEQDDHLRTQWLENGANYLWNNEISNMRQLLTIFAKHHWPHHYNQKVTQVLEL